MAWGLPDKGVGDSDIMSILFGEYLQILSDGIEGRNCVLFGCALTGGADMTPAIAKGAVLSNGVMFPVTAADVTIGAADGTNPRIDLIVITSAGAKAVRAGTAAAAPKPPARSANDVVLYAVYVPAADTSIETTKAIDMRVMKTQGPITVYKTTAAETTNTTAAAIQVLNKANSGVTIPNGLFLAGRMLRIQVGGNYLMNNGTATMRLVIAYGGTTMYSDISAAGVNSATRRAWALDLILTAQGNSDQALGGQTMMQDVTVAPTAATTGLGDVWGIASTAEGPTPISGAAAVNSDAADSLLSVQITFSVSNVANEVVTEYASVELV